MTEYQPSGIGPEYAIEVWTDDVRLIGRLGPTDDLAAARTNLQAIRRGIALARLITRDSAEASWREMDERPDPRAAYLHALTVAQTFAENPDLPLVYWFVSVSVDGTGVLVAWVHGTSARSVLEAYARHLGVEVAGASRTLVLAQVRGVEVQVRTDPPRGLADRVPAKSAEVAA